MNKLYYYKTFAVLLFFSLIIMSCSTQSDSQMGNFKVLLHDAPANYDELNVFIERVEVNREGDDEGWITVGEPEQTFDLLELTNGVLAPLGEIELEAGNYEQVRLILSEDGHNVVVDGETHDLFIPSGTQTGIKLNINAEIIADIEYTLLLDFDANRSVVETGNAQSGRSYLLKPVIKATNQAITGNVSGFVSPAEAEPVVFAIANGDTLSSTYADTADGSFRLIGLEEGDYIISADPTNTNYQAKDTTGVEVIVGETTELDTLELVEN